MTNVDKLKEEERAKLHVGEVSLEELIILGEDKKIPLIIEYPTAEGVQSAKVYCKQLTLTELENVDTNSNDLKLLIPVLRKTLFKQDYTNFTKQELMALPIGVLKSLMVKIFELSGMTTEAEKLKDF